MLYVCSVPFDATWNEGNWNDTPLYVIDMLPILDRDGLSGLVWAMYRKLYKYDDIWIIGDKELKRQNITNVKYHLGET